MDSQPNVLIVDDDPIMIILQTELIRRNFPSLGIYSAVNGEDALAILHTKDIAFLLTDMMMPGMSGIELIRQAKQQCPELFCMIITAASSIETAVDAIKQGADQYMPKPVDKELLKIILTDWLDKFQKKRQLLKKADSFETIFTAIGQSPITIAITDTDGSIAFTTRTQGDLHPDLRKKPRPWLLNDNTIPQQMQETIWQTIRSKRAWTGEFISSKENGAQRWERATISPVLNEKGAVVNFIVFQEDITCRKEIEAKQEQMLNMAMEQDRLASLGAIATGVAHEINQPLTFIYTVLQTTMEKISAGKLDTEKLHQKLDRAVHQAERITSIINQMRTFGRADSVETRPTDLATIVGNTLILMKDRLRGNNITLNINIEESLPTVLGNRNKLEQVFINFFQNAIDALSEQGGGEISLDIGRKNNWLDITFADNGPGIPAEIQPKIFEQFFTTKEVGKGTGMGLALVHSIINEHHGKISCKSEPGTGTTFIISLPLSIEEAK